MCGMGALEMQMKYCWPLCLMFPAYSQRDVQEFLQEKERGDSERHGSTRWGSEVASVRDADEERPS